MRTATIIGNGGGEYEIIAGLHPGQKLLCIRDQESESGAGFWSTDTYTAFEKGKIYKVAHLTNWDGVMVAYVSDEDSCLTWAKPDTFKLLNE